VAASDAAVAPTAGAGGDDRIDGVPLVDAGAESSERVDDGRVCGAGGGDSGPDLPGVGRGDCQGSGRVSTGFVGMYGTERVAAVQSRLREVAGQVD
jgi:hypothetical protein